MKSCVRGFINSYDPYGYGEFLYEFQMIVKKHNIVHNGQVTIYDIHLSYFKKINYKEILRKKSNLLLFFGFPS